MGKITRLVLCGSSGAGKTSFMNRMLYGETNQPVYKTIEDTYMIQIDTERGVKETVKVIDTNGYNWTTPSQFPYHYFNFADGFVLMYSTSDSESFKCIQNIKKELDKMRDKKDIFVVVVGIKLDTNLEATYMDKIISSWVTKERIKRFEASLSNKKQLSEPFVYICSKMTQSSTKTTLLGSSRRLLKQQSSEV